jgi:UDP-N-acetylglucosamine 2-epimerase (non-hydrolysing)
VTAAPAPVVHVVGARPNFVKAAPVIAALRERAIPQLLVHTGQHYDDRLSAVFFEELGIPDPDVNLGVGSGSHATQTAEIMVGLEREFGARRPRIVVVYGDVNSTLAAAIVAAKLEIPVAHVEAGLRSFDMSMPEEINRRVTDQLSELLFVTSPEGVGHLANEGLDIERIHFVGNPMIDTLLAHMDRFEPEPVRIAHSLPERYAVATLHRPSNVDREETAADLVAALRELARDVAIAIPVHPRGRAMLDRAGLSGSSGIHVMSPLGYVEFLSLVRGAAAVITDSGGVQEETTVLGVPCLTLRPNTERPITITHGTNRLVSTQQLVACTREAMNGRRPPREMPPLWDGQAGPRIAGVLAGWLAGH